MSWVRLDDMRTDNQKLMEAGFEARGMDEAAMCWCARHKTDGHITTAGVASLAAGHGCKNWKKVAQRLVDVGRWVPNAAGWEIHDFLEFNPSQAALKEAQRRKQAAGQLGGLRSGQSRQATKHRTKNEAPALAAPQAAGCEAESNLLEAKTNPPSPIGLKTSSSSNALPDEPPKSDDDDENLKPGKPPARHDLALEILADRRIANRTGNPVTNPTAYRASVIRSLETELADQLATAPTFATLDELVRWLDPPSPVDLHAAAQAAIRARNDGPSCPTCDGNRFVETPKGAIPCPECQTA